MQACRIRCYHYDKAFNVGFNSPQARRYQADSVIVRIDFSDGTVGFGECAPRRYVTGEDCASVVRLLRHRFSPLLFEHPIPHLAAAEALLAELEQSSQEAGIAHYHSALGAVDLALIDGLERSQRLSADQLFPVAYRSELRFSASIPFLPQAFIEAYFPLLDAHVDIAVIKILVGEDIQANRDRVALIRRLSGPDTELRLEFNGKMTLNQVKQNLQALVDLGIKAVEQPLPPHQDDALHELHDAFDLDLVADEALVTLEDARALARGGAYSIFNIKVSKCGGLLRSMRIAELADAHAIQCQIGTHVGESPLLTLAGRRMAYGLPNFDCYGGGSEFLFSRLFEARPQAVEARVASSRRTSRLGIETCRELVSGHRVLLDIRS